MKPGDFLDTAQRLATGTTEADWRSAISRAYYAAFHHFREFILRHGLNLGPSGQSHFNLYAGLFNCGFSAVAKIGQTIDDQRIKRVKADYDLQTALDQAAATDAVNTSRNVIADFQVHLQSIPAAQIVGGAKKYLQAIGKLGKTP